MSDEQLILDLACLADDMHEEARVLRENEGREDEAKAVLENSEIVRAAARRLYDLSNHK